VPENSPTSTINLQEVQARADSAQHIITGFARAMPNLGDLWQQITHSLSDIPILTVEATRLGSALTIVRLDRANLAAAGRASLNAYRLGEPDPLWYLRDELAAQGFIAGQRGRS
jgi:hypothetical protein